MNPMKEIRLGKLTLNICTGEPGPELEKAKRLLVMIAGTKIVTTKTKKSSTCGVAKGRNIGVMTTLRGKEARDALSRLLRARENIMQSSQFDENGNFSFGIDEYINIPEVDYEPEVGIMGLDVCVTLERPGYRVGRRRYERQRIGKDHRIKAEEAIGWVKKEFGVEVN